MQLWCLSAPLAPFREDEELVGEVDDAAAVGVPGGALRVPAVLCAARPGARDGHRGAVEERGEDEEATEGNEEEGHDVGRLRKASPVC